MHVEVRALRTARLLGNRMTRAGIRITINLDDAKTNSSIAFDLDSSRHLILTEAIHAEKNEFPRKSRDGEDPIADNPDLMNALSSIRRK
jgi:hypothetical protein